MNPIIISAAVGLPLLMLGPYRRELGMSVPESIAFSAAYWAAIALTAASWYLGWLGGLGPMISFAVYWTIMSAAQAVAFAYLWLRTRHPDIKGASWIVIYNVLLGIVSYVGSLGPLPTPLVSYPWDYLLWAVLSLAVYFIAVRVAYLTKDLKQIKESGLPME